MSQILFHFDAPVCTVERFAELTGLTRRTIDNYISQGRIPIVPKQGKSEKVLINMVAYTQQTADLANPTTSRRAARRQTEQARQPETGRNTKR